MKTQKISVFGEIYTTKKILHCRQQWQIPLLVTQYFFLFCISLVVSHMSLRYGLNIFEKLDATSPLNIQVNEDFEICYARALRDYQRHLRLRRIQIVLRLSIFLLILIGLALLISISVLLSSPPAATTSTSTSTEPTTPTSTTTSTKHTTETALSTITTTTTATNENLTGQFQSIYTYGCRHFITVFVISKVSWW